MLQAVASTKWKSVEVRDELTLCKVIHKSSVFTESLFQGGAKLTRDSQTQNQRSHTLLRIKFACPAPTYDCLVAQLVWALVVVANPRESKSVLSSFERTSNCQTESGMNILVLSLFISKILLPCLLAVVSSLQSCRPRNARRLCFHLCNHLPWLPHLKWKQPLKTRSASCLAEQNSNLKSQSSFRSLRCS